MMSCAGKTEDEMIEVDMVVEEVRDFAREFTMLCYSENYDKVSTPQSAVMVPYTEFAWVHCKFL